MARNAVISFGMVNIPVGVEPIAKSNGKGITFKTLCAEHEVPIKQFKVCPKCVKQDKNNNIVLPETQAEPVKGYEYAKGQYLVVTEDEIEECKPEASPVIKIECFAPSEDFPVWAETSRWLTQKAEATGSYNLLTQALNAEGVIAVGKATLWGKEHPCVISEYLGCLVLTDVYPQKLWQSPTGYIDGGFTDPELELARTLVRSMTKDGLDPSLYTSESSDLLEQMIEAKLANKEFVILTNEDELAETPDIMAALQASIEKVGVA